MELTQYDQLSQKTFTPREILEEETAKRNFLWQQQQRGYNQLLRIAEGEKPEVVFGSRNMTRGFLLNTKHFLGCMDGRVLMMDKHNRWRAKIGIGANGRLLDDLQFEKFVQRIQTVFREVLHKDPSWMKVTYHALCGACGKFCGEQNPRRKELGLPLLTPEQAGKQVAKRLMENLGIAGDPIFIAANWLDGDEHFHPERSVAIDTTAVARPQEIGDREHGKFPQTFELGARLYPTMEKLMEETAIAIGIALDEHHGMGEKFTNSDGTENRLLLTVFEDETAPDLVAQVRRGIEPITKKFHDRVLPVFFPVSERFARNDGLQEIYS